jgi:anti-sigma regulatory factor (Ser/Thr protein kinase)
MSRPRDPSGPGSTGHAVPSFRHEALLYAGHDQLLERVVPFLRAGLHAGETTAVLLEADKIALLREALGEDAGRVHFTDTAGLGRNPARLIPWWRRFIDEHLRTDRPVRAVGAPGLTGRGPAEVDEYLAHEALLNVAFADDPPWSLLCPYDVDVLASAVLDEFRRNHPFVVDDDGSAPNSGYRPADVPGRLDQPLTPPPADAQVIGFERDRGALRRVRTAVTDHAARCGLDATATDHLVVAVNELVSNSVDHGGGQGTLRLWRDGGVVVCEVTDAGRLTGPPLLGRQYPDVDRIGGRGLWLVNQVCDLVQIRASPAGTTVRVHVWPSGGV